MEDAAAVADVLSHLQQVRRAANMGNMFTPNIDRKKALGGDGRTVLGGSAGDGERRAQQKPPLVRQNAFDTTR